MDKVIVCASWGSCALSVDVGWMRNPSIDISNRKEVKERHAGDRDCIETVLMGLSSALLPAHSKFPRINSSHKVSISTPLVGHTATSTYRFK